MTYYSYNALTRVLSAEPNYIVLADGATIANPSAEQNAALRDAYPKGEDAPMPTPPEGKIVEYGGYELGESDHLWHKQWIVVDAPPPPPRTFSKLRIEDALFRAGVLDAADAFIDAQTITNEHGQTMPLRRKYQTANDFSEAHPLFAQFKAALQTELGWTDEQVESVLAAAEGGA